MQHSKPEDRTLVIVDMQRDFPASRDKRVIAGVVNQIKLAKKYGWPIVILEYNNTSFETHPVILSRLDDYRNRYIIMFKYRDGGGKQVLNACMRNGFPDKFFRVCGVNTSFCVYSTVEDLVKDNKKVEIVTKACNCDHHLVEYKEPSWAKNIGRQIYRPILPNTRAVKLREISKMCHV